SGFGGHRALPSGAGRVSGTYWQAGWRRPVGASWNAARNGRTSAEDPGGSNRAPSPCTPPVRAGEALGMAHASDAIRDAVDILVPLDVQSIDRMVSMLARLRERGRRLFILGVRGSAANASHMVNDFRKIARIETYTPTDNVSELTARTNDEGWDTVFVRW